MMAYFKQMWNFKLKQTLFDYCLINLFNKPDKFITNNLFDKKIVLLNMKKVYLFANISTNKFLRDIISTNVIFFWIYQKVISKSSVSYYYNKIPY